jgi:hypothetical protein
VIRSSRGLARRSPEYLRPPHGHGGSHRDAPAYGNAELRVIETVNVNYADVTARQRRLYDLPDGINHHDRHSVTDLKS